MPTVTFVKENKEIEVPEGTDLRTAARRAGISVYDGINGFGAKINEYLVNCHGNGICGTCRVLVTRGMENTNKMTAREWVRLKTPIPEPLACLAYMGNEETMRLSCQTRIVGDVDVETAPPLNLFGVNFFS